MKPEISYNEIKNPELVDNVRNSFPVKFLSFGEVFFGGRILIAAVEFDAVDSLENHWKQFNSFISTEILSIKKDEFSKWNFYVLYLSSDLIKRDIKYEIENNKFSSRKIVFDKCASQINTETIARIIKEHITNDNIIEVTKDEDIKGVEKNSIIIDALNKIKAPTKKSEQSDYMDLVLNEIRKSLQNEI